MIVLSWRSKENFYWKYNVLYKCSLLSTIHFSLILETDFKNFSQPIPLLWSKPVPILKLPSSLQKNFDLWWICLSAPAKQTSKFMSLSTQKSNLPHFLLPSARYLLIYTFNESSKIFALSWKHIEGKLAG